MELATASARLNTAMKDFGNNAASMEATQRAYFDRFNSDMTLTLSGTVAEFQWTNPIARIILTTSNGANWTIEMNPPAGIARIGWRPETLTPGMPVTVMIHPLRYASHGGYLLSAFLPDGTELSGGRDRPVTLQELREATASAEARTREFLKKNQLLDCVP
jgi:hypothetical protein